MATVILNYSETRLKSAFKTGLLSDEDIVEMRRRIESGQKLWMTRCSRDDRAEVIQLRPGHYGSGRGLHWSKKRAEP